MTTFVNEFFTKENGFYNCNLCNTKCCRKSEWLRHLSTRKHKKCEISTENSEIASSINADKYVCHCKKVYKDRSGLWRHKQKCSEETNGEITPDDKNFDKDMFFSLLQQNNEFKNVILEQSRQIMELAKNNNSITNNINNTTNNNQKFNMNFFLNEQCKDALDIMDFVNSLKVQLTDLENTGKVGYVKGISDIFLRGLKELDIYKRPIHCSDLKREVMYVKDKDVWEKDQDKKKVKKAIQNIAHKNFKQINEWVEVNPESKDIQTKKHDEYMKILIKCSGGINLEEDDVFYNKIITNVAKVVHIDK
jgi:hypothetical protein